MFRLACRYSGQCSSPTLLAREIQRALSADVGPQRIRSYLRHLDSSLLLRLVHPLEIRLGRSSGYPKLCLCDHALRAAWLGERIPLVPSLLDAAPHLNDLAGRIAESTVGYYLMSLPGHTLSRLPKRAGEPEVDYVVTVGQMRIPIEVKYRRVLDPLRDTIGLRTFLEKMANNATFGLLIARSDSEPVPDARIVTVPLPTFLIVR